VALFKKVFYNMLVEDITSSVLNSNPEGSGYGGPGNNDMRLPFAYGPSDTTSKSKKKGKKAKKKKKKIKIMPFTRFGGGSGMTGPSGRSSTSFG
tara:strand:- start:30708 stop:30989 length:282 start_codon:yes stop_codon:yes gene_type:complete